MKRPHVRDRRSRVSLSIEIMNLFCYVSHLFIWRFDVIAVTVLNWGENSSQSRIYNQVLMVLMKACTQMLH